MSSMSRSAYALRRPVAALFGAVLALVLSAAAFTAYAQPAAMQEGKQYVRLKNAVPVETGNKIEVIEFFSYGCPHCADLEPIIENWAKTLPPDVQFRRVPVLFQPRWVTLGKEFYALEALGVDQRLNGEVFNAIHKQGTDLSNEKTFLDWVATKGVDRKKAEDMMNSFGINGKVNRAKSQAAAYNIQSVPTVVIDGKFVTASDKVGSHSNLPAAINALVDKARAERGGKR